MSGYYDPSFGMDNPPFFRIEKAIRQSTGDILYLETATAPKRTDENGLDDSGFVFPVITGPGAAILNMIGLPSDDFLVGGRFATIDGETIPTYAIFDIDCVLDTGFVTAGTAVNERPLLRLASGKTILEIGTPGLLKRVNSDGSNDGGFTAPIIKYNLGDTSDTDIHSIAEGVDNKIILAGNIRVVGSDARNGVARLNTDGTIDSGFDPDVTLGPDNGTLIYGLCVQADGKILIGGDFDAIGGTARLGLARLNTDGTLDTGFDPPVITYIGNPKISSIQEQPDGQILITGWFSAIDSEPRTGVARLNPDGSLDTDFEPASLLREDTDNPGDYLPAIVHGAILLPTNDVIVYGLIDLPAPRMVRLTEVEVAGCFWTGLVNATQVC